MLGLYYFLVLSWIIIQMVEPKVPQQSPNPTLGGGHYPEHLPSRASAS